MRCALCVRQSECLPKSCLSGRPWLPADPTGEYVGLELDRPEGKHTGEVDGISYFRCEPMHGELMVWAQRSHVCGSVWLLEPHSACAVAAQEFLSRRRC